MEVVQEYGDNRLLCTFTKRQFIRKTLKNIFEKYNTDKIYVFEDTDNRYNVMCTYNINKKDDSIDRLKNTISVHRKQISSTLYTIDAINKIVGHRDDKNKVELNWEQYKNSFLLTNKEGDLNIIKTKLLFIKNNNRIKTWKIEKTDE